MSISFKRKIAWAIMLGAAGVFTATFVHAYWYVPEMQIVPPEDVLIVDVSPEELPARIRIPALEIDTKVQHVTVNSTGNMASPSNFTDVGWYKPGTVPGQRGSAVIAGHLDNGLSLPGVFKHLDQVKVGDDIYIVTEGGRELHFRVEETVAYPYKEVPLERLFNRSDKPRLNLVTCVGDWVKAEKTYDQRLVVYAVLVDG